MSGILFAPFYAAIDGDGVPMAGAKLYFYTTGTTTPQHTYTAADLVTPNANPVVADADGLFPPIYLAPGPDYKAILRTAADVTVATRDPIALGGGGGGGIPQGRLSLVTGVPVMTSNQTGKTIVYYTPYVGNQIGIWSGSEFVSTTFAELSNDLTASAVGNAGPAAAGNNSNYDLFVWSDGGTMRLTRGPAWSSGTARGTGVGTTELARVQGVLVNAQSISNGPIAGFGTYVGSIRTDGSAQVNWHTGGVAANGTAAILGVWNAHNRRKVTGLISDTTNSWTYTTATWRPANNSSTMRVSYVAGLAEDPMKASYWALAANSGAGNSVYAGVGFDSTSAPAGLRRYGVVPVNNGLVAPTGQHSVTALGFHFLQALELSDAAGTSTWFGDAGTIETPTGLIFEGWF